ncbi:hypothetical protein SAMN06295888_11485 [Desulfonatronum zhilinae]|nr:hypothetical protein SAMN06295888_11485 [Desulfonatronum zhilinae]
MVKDDTAEKRPAQELKRVGVFTTGHAAEYAESIVNTIRESLLVLDAELVEFGERVADVFDHSNMKKEEPCG